MLRESSGQAHCEEKPRSQNRDLGHPLKVWRVQRIFDRGIMGLRPTQGDEKPLLFSNYSLWKRHPPLVIPSEAEGSEVFSRSATPFLMGRRFHHKTRQRCFLALIHRPSRPPQHVSRLIRQQQHDILLRRNLQGLKKLCFVDVQGHRIPPRLGWQQATAQGRVQPPSIQSILTRRNE
jgi:hypothetical protein